MATWRLVIYAIGVGLGPMSVVDRIKGFNSSVECLKRAEKVEKTTGMYAQCIKN